MTLTESYTIISGNFERAGLASRRLKDRLKKIGIAPDILRRIMIAAYEAEMNVVIHANNGEMWVTLDDQQIRIEVHDEGPGIPDIDAALRPGFSTASEYAKTLGFGAGMGLPNIKKHSDIFEITSVVGQGTALKSIIFLKKQHAGIVLPHSIAVHTEKCCGCLQCLHACPTKAIRVRNDTPQILEHLCIDCTACLAACETGALTMRPPPDLQLPMADATLVLPFACLVQFEPEAAPQHVQSILEHLGFQRTRFVESWEYALRQAVLAHSVEHPATRPIIAPVCPAVINLIEARFPALLPNVALFMSPVEAVYEELQHEQVVLVPSCPCQQTAVLRKGLSDTMLTMSPAQVFEAVMPLLGATAKNPYNPSEQTPFQENTADNVLSVSGLRNVINILEKAENGLLNDVSVVELFVCDQGCFGSPLLKEGPFLARYRWRRFKGQNQPESHAYPRSTAFVARQGLRLAQSMSESIQKLADIDRLTKMLPGKNCGVCGSPTCAALAEDVVMGRATVEMCAYRKT